MEPRAPITAQQIAANWRDAPSMPAINQPMIITGRTAQDYADQLNNPGTEEAHAFAKFAAARICESYGIQGICDPGYIANVITVEWIKHG